MHVNITAPEQILAIIRGVHRLAPEGRNESIPAPKAFGTGSESINVGPVPVGTIKRSCSPRRSWLQFRLFPSVDIRAKIRFYLSSLTGRSHLFEHPAPKAFGAGLLSLYPSEINSPAFV